MIKKNGDKRAYITSWFLEVADDEKIKNITSAALYPMDSEGLSNYILRFYVRKGSGKYTEYYQLSIGYTETIKDIKNAISRWMVEKGNDIFPNKL